MSRLIRTLSLEASAGLFGSVCNPLFVGFGKEIYHSARSSGMECAPHTRLLSMNEVEARETLSEIRTFARKTSNAGWGAIVGSKVAKLCAIFISKFEQKSYSGNG